MFAPYVIAHSYCNRVFSHDVTAAILVFQNNELMVAMLVSHDNPVGIELFSLEKTFFVPMN